MPSWPPGKSTTKIGDAALPVVAALTNCQAYSVLRQFPCALRERATVTTNLDGRWPRMSGVQYAGTVTGATLTSITDNTQHQAGDGGTPPAHQWAHTWFDYVFPHQPLGSSFYSIIIEGRDETKSVRADIVATETGGTSDDFPHGTTLQISSIADYVAAGIISSPADLIGRTYVLIYSNGIHFTERWLDWPNESELWKSEVDHADAAKGKLFIDTDQWAADQWKGNQVLVYGDDGKLHRTTITTNDLISLTYAPAGPWAPVDKFLIVAAGAIGFPGRLSASAFQWYGGPTKAYFSHYPDDGMGSAPMPADSVTFSAGEEGLCEDVTFGCFDNDVWSPNDNQCSLADICYTPKLFTTLRGMQLATELLAPNFVEPKDYTGQGAIPNYTLATFFHAAGINSGTTALEDKVGGAYHATVAAAYKGKSVYATVLNADGSIRWDSQADAGGSLAVNSTTGKIDLGTGFYDAADEAADPTHKNDVGKTVIYSAGWTRYYPREVINPFYDLTVFIPDIEPVVDEDTGESSLHVFDPPDADHPGRWDTRAKDTTYADHTNEGFAVAGSVAFVDGDLVRFKGDNWNDPTLGATHLGAIAVESSEDGPTADQLSVPYYDRQFVGRRNAIWQNQINGQFSGRCTGGTSFSITDTAQHFYMIGDRDGGAMRIESGTATGGSTTTLTDSSKAGNGLWDAATGRWTGFTLRMTSGANKGLKRPITAMSGTTLTTWAFPNPIGAGNTYEIDEPRYQLNRFKDYPLRITRPSDGMQWTVTVQFSDDDTLYYSAQSFTPQAGWEYELLPWQFGAVYRRQGGKFVAPTGNDSRGATFLVNLTENLPTIVKDYGRMMKGDYPDYDNAVVLRELYAAINKLVWTPGSPSWISRADDYTPENNWKFARSTNYSNWGFTYPQLWITDTDGGGTDPLFSDQGDALNHSGSAYMYDGVIPQVEHNWSACPAGGTIDKNDPGGPGEVNPWAINFELNGNGLDGDGLPIPGDSGSPPPRRYSTLLIGEDYYHGVMDPSHTPVFTGGSAYINKEAVYAYAKDTGIPSTIFACKVEYYAYADTPNQATPGTTWTTSVDDDFGHDFAHGTKTTFDPNGTSMRYQLWASFDASGGASNSTTRISEKLGDLSEPITPSTLAPESFYGMIYTNDYQEIVQANSTQGYQVTDVKSLRKWNVPGGFKYIDTLA